MEPETKDPFLEILNKGLPHTAHKWRHYLPLYHRYFSPYRQLAEEGGRQIVLLEIGVQNGGSLDMWNAYFGPEKCQIFGVDIQPACRALERGNVKIFQGSQLDQAFLRSLPARMPAPDIIIDDGGHSAKMQINSLEILFPFLRPGGIYLCEDTHSSYMKQYIDQIPTFIDRAKTAVDQLHGHWLPPARRSGGEVTRWCSGIHFHNSMVFLDKAESPLTPPTVQYWRGSEKELFPTPGS